MASEIEIANRAITKLGGARITSFDDNSTEARTMRAIFPTVRRALLRRAVWNFAKKRAKIANIVTSQDWAFKNQAALPDDFIRLIQVNDYSEDLNSNPYRDTDDAPYRLEGGNILTNYPAPLKIIYVADIADPTKFDALFVELFASQLAWEGCETITQSNTKKASLIQETRMWLSEARKVNAIEWPAEGIHDDSWARARF